MRVLTLIFLFFFTGLLYANPVFSNDSIYQLDANWQTENNESIQLASFAGKPQVVALIFTGCSTACPVIVESMKRIEKKIKPSKKNQIGFVLVSLTPDTDYPKVLKAFAKRKKLNQNWTLLRGNNESVRVLSNLLNGRYKRLKNNDVAHSNTVTLLNQHGNILTQGNGTLTGIKSVIESINKNYPYLMQ